MFEDLKVDYVNPVDFSKRLNEVRQRGACLRDSAAPADVRCAAATLV